jgi:hypothetical protein
MSFDVIIQDLPPGVRDVREIPDDYVPGPLASRAEVLDAIARVAPDAVMSAAGSGGLERDDWSIALELGEGDPVHVVALQLRGGREALDAAASIVVALGGRALAPATPTGLFDAAEVAAAFDAWRAFRDEVA